MRIGKLKRKTIYGKTRQEVKDKLENLITDLKTDKYVDKSKIILRDLAEEFVEDLYRLNKLNDNSYVRKRNTLKELEKHYIAFMEIQQITEENIKDFFEFMTIYSNSIIDKVYGLLNNTFKRALRKNIIRYNPLDDKVELGKPRSKQKDKKVRGFTVEEQKSFLNVIMDNKIKYKYQYLISLYTGLRMGEINALDINKDIDFKNKVIHVRRTLTKDKNDKTIMGTYAKTPHSIRDVDMNLQVEYILKDYLKKEYILNKENLLFYDTKKEKYISTAQVNSAFKRLCEKYNIALGYDVNQHMLRHTFATRCIEAGMPANVLCKKMGHSKIQTTLDIYCDVFNKYEEKYNTKTLDYLKENDLLLIDTEKDNKKEISNIDLEKLFEIIKNMYEKQDTKLINIFNMVA